MPLYEYRCEDCKKLFEALVSSHVNADKVSCTACGSAKVKRTISAASFRLASGGSSIPSGALTGCSSRGGFS